MTAYLGNSRNTPYAVTVNDVGCGAAWVTCIECDGTGLFFGHPEYDSLTCNVCKGSKKTLIAI